MLVDEVIDKLVDSFGEVTLDVFLRHISSVRLGLAIALRGCGHGRLW
jgi:hypothetical protein